MYALARSTRGHELEDSAAEKIDILVCASELEGCNAMDSFQHEIASSNSSATTDRSSIFNTNMLGRVLTQVVVRHPQIEQAARGALDFHAAFVQILPVHMLDARKPQR